jgi:hypothetical protein
MSRILREEFFLRRNIGLNLPILVETIKTLLFGRGEFVTDPRRRCSPALGQPVLDVHPIPVTFAEGLPAQALARRSPTSRGTTQAASPSRFLFPSADRKRESHPGVLGPVEPPLQTICSH